MIGPRATGKTSNLGGGTAFVDAHVILRFLQGWPPEQPDAAERLFDAAQRGVARLAVHPVVLSEVVYVAVSPHGLGLTRRAVADELLRFLQLDGLDIVDRQTTLDALQLFAASRVDWADCVLLSHLPRHRVYTFDREMLSHRAQSPEERP